MPSESNLHPLLQIVHVSDFHIMHIDRRQAMPRFRRLQWALERTGLWETGTRPHDVTAPRRFQEFLRNVTVNDPVWSDLPTWLVDTGDLTTFGDDESLGIGKEFHSRLKNTSQHIKLFSLHGNHDAWPNNFPLLITETEMKIHRYNLRRNWFTERLPKKVLSLRIPHTDYEIQLFGLNSTIHDRFENARAIGRVNEDRYWERNQEPRPLHQIHQLGEIVKNDISEGISRSLRIAAIHHPIHFPGKEHWWQKKRTTMYLANAHAVAREMNRDLPAGCSPLIHIILSGHIHKLFPDIGCLPPTVRHCRHPRLELDQCQLIVGSLMQLNFEEEGHSDQNLSEQAQILRFYHADNSPENIIIERLIACRGSHGAFKFAKIKKKDSISETIETQI